MNIYDISRTLHCKTPTWPGDTPFSYSLNWTKEETGSVNVGSIEMSVHTATHIDAPYHFDEKGAKVDQLDLSVFMGRAIVVDVSKLKELNRVSLEALLKGQEKKRVLFKTNAWEDEEVFPEGIPSLKLDAITLLKELSVPLIGVDLPSVDQLESKDLEVHHLLHETNIAILEGIDLRNVDEGEYQLVALPLKIEGADGSPVRAVLVRE
ncbi:arylformamidase [Bacillus tianshenii]|uniref:arylformamidase n=1 Tax=Sutcliffiella tianshenii TaxID=1463404 RepID=UPI001CD34F68|nr:arylformamidase [Bacillus tianshenii]MCA1319294.1 arylformamidase [Bacillus tianshenii]